MNLVINSNTVFLVQVVDLISQLDSSFKNIYGKQDRYFLWRLECDPSDSLNIRHRLCLIAMKPGVTITLGAYGKGFPNNGVMIAEAVIGVTIDLTKDGFWVGGEGPSYYSYNQTADYVTYLIEKYFTLKNLDRKSGVF